MEIGVLISGRGSNLQALIDAIAEGRLGCDDRRRHLESRRCRRARARARGGHRDAGRRSPRRSPTRDDFDRGSSSELARVGVALVCLAGFMRLIGAPLLEAFPNAILNVHPSLLPAFPGVDAQRQALEHGVKVAGATVHLVTAELDGGPIVLQAAVPVRDDDTVETLSARILIEEHRIYPEAVRILLDGGWTIEGRRFIRDAAMPTRRQEQPVAHARRVIRVPVQVARAGTRLRRTRAGASAASTAEAERESDPRSERQPLNGIGGNHPRVSGMADDGVGSLIDDVVAAVLLNADHRREEPIGHHRAEEQRAATSAMPTSPSEPHAVGHLVICQRPVEARRR